MNKPTTLARLLALLLSLTLIAVSCSSGEENEKSSDTATAQTGDADKAADKETDTVELTQTTDATFHVITHGDGGVFWSVAQKGAEQAAADLGVTVKYQGANNDSAAQSQMIEAAIAEGSDGIAISLADPAGLEAAAKAVVDAGIPLYTLNSGVNQFTDLGAVTHIGQTEVVAGNGAGEFFNGLGAKKILCARQEQSNVGLEERCQGLAETFNGEVISEFMGTDADPDQQEANLVATLQANPDIDAVLGTGPNMPVRAVAAAQTAGVEITIGGFDISEDIIGAIESGDVAFTVDQQQYLQGYLPVMFMHLQHKNLNTVGGGLPVLTGPGFVTTDNVGEVKALVSSGTR